MDVVVILKKGCTAPGLTHRDQGSRNVHAHVVCSWVCSFFPLFFLPDFLSEIAALYYNKNVLENILGALECEHFMFHLFFQKKMVPMPKCFFCQSMGFASSGLL